MYLLVYSIYYVKLNFDVMKLFLILLLYEKLLNYFKLLKLDKVIIYIIIFSK